MAKKPLSQPQWKRWPVRLLKWGLCTVLLASFAVVASLPLPETIVYLDGKNKISQVYVPPGGALVSHWFSGELLGSKIYNQAHFSTLEYGPYAERMQICSSQPDRYPCQSFFVLERLSFSDTLGNYLDDKPVIFSEKYQQAGTQDPLLEFVVTP